MRFTERQVECFNAPQFPCSKTETCKPRGSNGRKWKSCFIWDEGRVKEKRPWWSFHSAVLAYQPHLPEPCRWTVMIITLPCLWALKNNQSALCEGPTACLIPRSSKEKTFHPFGVGKFYPCFFMHLMSVSLFQTRPLYSFSQIIHTGGKADS